MYTVLSVLITTVIIGGGAWLAVHHSWHKNVDYPVPIYTDLMQHLRRQREFSLRTYGPGKRTQGVCDHVRKEMREIRADPTDLEEWVDLIILSFDGAHRTGVGLETIAIVCLCYDFRPSFGIWSFSNFNKFIEQHIKTILDRESDDEYTQFYLWCHMAVCGFYGAKTFANASPEAILDALHAKQLKNENRTWPDWRTADPNKAIEHVRT